MNLNLTFSDNDAFKPSLSVSIGASETFVKRPRWVQFLSLLAYRRLTGLENGWVRLDDVSRLLAFQKAKPQVIGKYLSSSSVEFPGMIRTFLKKSLDITTTGPYTLMLDVDQIVTDFTNLEKYLRWITSPAVRERSDLQSLWKVARLTYQKHNYSSYQNILQSFISASINDKQMPPFCLPYAYIRLADTEKICNSNIIDPKQCLVNARRLAHDLKSTKWKNILLADASDIESIGVEKSRNFYKRFVTLNNQSSQLLNQIPENSISKLNMLAKTYSNAFYADLIILKSYDERLFKAISEIGRQLQDDMFLSHFKLKSALLLRLINNERATEDEISWYHELLEYRSISTMRTFDQGTMIWRSLVNARDYEFAYHFGQDCLIQHADLIETARFRRLVADQKKLKKIVG